jgi:uncharacterized protein YegP (UPF0339 family)
MASQFQVYQDKAGEYRWRLIADNHETIAQSSEGYTNKAGAIRGAEIISEGGLSGAPEIYQDKAGDYRFRYTAPNGNIIAVGESYPEEKDCSHAVSLLHKLGPKAPVVDKS